MTSACNMTAADNYALYYQTDIDIWLSTSCGMLFCNPIVHVTKVVMYLQTVQHHSVENNQWSSVISSSFEVVTVSLTKELPFLCLFYKILNLCLKTVFTCNVFDLTVPLCNINVRYCLVCDRQTNCYIVVVIFLCYVHNN